MNDQTYDVLVIGAGSGGYIASVRAGQLGLRVGCVEANAYADPKGEARPGGTCLNVGCIPSKALLSSSEEFEKIKKHASQHGIRVSGAEIDVQAMVSRKASVVTKMAKGIEFLFRKNKVEFLKGRARLLGKDADGIRVQFTQGSKEQVLKARNLIIATGSLPRQLPGIPVDNVDICDNAGVLSRNRRKFRQPINVACPAPGRWGRPNSRVTSRHFDHGNASRTSRPDCSGLDEAD